MATDMTLRLQLKTHHKVKPARDADGKVIRRRDVLVAPSHRAALRSRVRPRFALHEGRMTYAPTQPRPDVAKLKRRAANRRARASRKANR